MLGYWRRPAATRTVLVDGVLHTGDLGYIKDGLLFPRDRRDNLILRGGASVYPAQVERVIRSLTGVADCAVVGLPDPRLGQRVAAAVETNGDTPLRAEDVVDHCRQRLARYEIPEWVIFVPTLPRNTMNKVVRRAVLDLVEQTLLSAAHAPNEMRDERPTATGAV